MNKSNPDYSASAVNLMNSPVIKPTLDLYHTLLRERDGFEAALQKTEWYKELERTNREIIQCTASLKGLIDEQGSYQDIGAGEYAVKQRRESMVYLPELARKHLPATTLPVVIVESVNGKALEGLVKGGIVTPEQARQCGEVKETFAYIIR